MGGTHTFVVNKLSGERHSSLHSQTSIVGRSYPRSRSLQEGTRDFALFWGGHDDGGGVGSQASAIARGNLKLAASIPSQATQAPPEGGLPLWRYRARQLTKTRLFDFGIGLVIVSNAVTIGLELTYELEGKDTSTLITLDNIWLVFYGLELLLRLFGFGRACLADHWVKLDVVLTVLGIIDSAIGAQIQARGKQFDFLTTLRMVRLARLARTVRLLVKFQVLWMLVRGLLSSAGTMFYTLLLLTIILYIFSAIGVELISKNSLVDEDEEFASVVGEYFGSLPGTMLTLIQFACLDGVGAIYRPLIKKDLTLLFYFCCIILVVPVVLMNLVTAIIVSSALDQVSADREVAKIYEEAKKARLVKQLRAIFMRLDEDSSGQVSRAEIVNIDQSDRDVLQDATGISDPIDVFNALNVDGEETLSIDDFCTGIWKLATSKATIEVQRMEKQVSTMFNRVKLLESKQSDLGAVLLRVLANQEYMQRSLANMDAALRGDATVPRVHCRAPTAEEEHERRKTRRYSRAPKSSPPGSEGSPPGECLDDHGPPDSSRPIFLAAAGVCEH